MILVTGGTGFLGRTLVTDLLEQGHSVRLLARDPILARELFPRADVVKGTLDSDLTHALKDVSQVIHLAGLISYTLPREELFRVNVEGTQNLLRAASKVDKFLFSSSISVYGECNGVTEDTPPRPRNHYGESKLAAEQSVEASLIPSLSYRLSVVYGPGSPIWARVMRLFGRGFPIPNTKAVVNLIHVSDVSRAFQLGLKKGTGVYNIAGDKPIPMKELASLLAYHLGIKPRFWPVRLVTPLAKLKGKGAEVEAYTQNRDVDGSKARKELGFEPEAFLEKELKVMVEEFLKDKSQG